MARARVFRPVRITLLWLLAALAALGGLTGCAERAALPVSAGMGHTPELPPPKPPLIPTVNIAPAKGWPAGAMPVPAAGLQVSLYAAELDHPRWLYTLPNGDVLVAETNRPPKDVEGGVRDWMMEKVMAKAGAGVPSANRITLLRDSNRDGVVDRRTVFLDGLNSPFGMALVGGLFYVANTDAVVRYPYKRGQTRITAKPRKLHDLPAGPRNHHWTKSLIAGRDGRKLYVGVGSNSNIGEYGMAEEEGRAAIWEIDRRTTKHRVLATGLRNPVGLDWEPVSGALWAVVNERDELGNDVPPDYMTVVRDGGFYGWPYSYFGSHVDERVQPQRPELVAKAIVPDYALGAHTAPLGFAFAPKKGLPEQFLNGAFIALHGSWNRRPHSGYRVIFVPFRGGRPAGDAVTVLSGFLSPEGEAYGRPVGIAFDRTGALLVADDVGNVVWRVSAASGERVAGR